MEIIARTKESDIASVFIGRTRLGSEVEFVESVQPPIPMSKKWVLIVSTMKGCPVGCRFCDCGSYYDGMLTKDEIIEQIDYLIRRRFPDGNVPVEKFKIQFARMGDPAFNMDLIQVLDELPYIYKIPGFVPSVSTIAPKGTDNFFESLLDVKQKHYKGNFQLQFSLHSTSEKQRDWLIPVKKWSFDRIAEYSKEFFFLGDKKISLNFALAKGSILDPFVLQKYFSSERFIIKITPVNPTFNSNANNIETLLLPSNENIAIKEELENLGYQVILSIGEWEENRIGSNCGQHILNYRNKERSIDGAYTYELISSKEVSF